MKRIIFIVILSAVLAAIFFILRSNKNKLDMSQELSEKDIQALPVRVDTVTMKSVGLTLSYATILEPADKLMVMSQTEGEVIRLNSSFGDRVQKGQTVVKVDDEILKANMEVARANFEKAKKDLERFENMYRQNGVTEDQLEKIRLNMKNARANMLNLEKRIELTSIEAPFAGFINQMFTKKGAILGPGVPVFEIINIDEFKINLTLSEEEVLLISEDMRVSVIPKSIDTVRFKGNISAIAKSSNMAQQYPVEISAENPYPDILKGGLIATVHINPLEDVLVPAVPRKSVRQENEQIYVYRIHEKTARKTKVQTGKQNEDFIEIKAGIDVGDLIITEGLEEMSDGQRVRIIRDSEGIDFE